MVVLLQANVNQVAWLMYSESLRLAKAAESFSDSSEVFRIGELGRLTLSTFSLGQEWELS